MLRNLCRVICQILWINLVRCVYVHFLEADSLFFNALYSSAHKFFSLIVSLFFLKEFSLLKFSTVNVWIF